jgi:hypothetical protein
VIRETVSFLFLTFGLSITFSWKRIIGKGPLGSPASRGSLGAGAYSSVGLPAYRQAGSALPDKSVAEFNLKISI